MDTSGCCTTQQQIKIIETYFDTKSVLLTLQQRREDFYSEFKGTPWGFPPENHAVFQKKLAFWEHKFCGSSMMTLSSFLTKFRSCKGKLIKIKQNEKHFEDVSQSIDNDLACWIWTIWTMLTTVAFVVHLLHLLSPDIWPRNVELTFYQVYCSCQNLSCIVAVSEELIFWQSSPQWFLSASA